MAKAVQVKFALDVVGMQKSLVKVVKKHTERFPEALRAQGNVLLTASQELVPTETMELHDAGAVRVVIDGLKSTCIVGYFGVPYAAYVHEDLEKLHGSLFNAAYAKQIAAGSETLKRPQETAKFLEKPYRDDTVLNNMRKAFKERMLRVSLIEEAAQNLGTQTSNLRNMRSKLGL